MIQLSFLYIVASTILEIQTSTMKPYAILLSPYWWSKIQSKWLHANSFLSPPIERINKAKAYMLYTLGIYLIEVLINSIILNIKFSHLTFIKFLLLVNISSCFVFSKFNNIYSANRLKYDIFLIDNIVLITFNVIFILYNYILHNIKRIVFEIIQSNDKLLLPQFQIQKSINFISNKPTQLKKDFFTILLNSVILNIAISQKIETNKYKAISEYKAGKISLNQDISSKIGKDCKTKISVSTPFSDNQNHNYTTNFIADFN